MDKTDTRPAGRLLSYSEISTAMTCQARHAFAYTGHLTNGDTLRPKRLLPVLSEGRAWGQAVAALHAENSLTAGTAALTASLDKDARRQTEFGLYDPALREQAEDRLTQMLAHYNASTSPLTVTRLEDEIVVPIPSRTGRRSSSRYKFLCHIDAWTEDYMGTGPWLVEYKLRTTLYPVWLIALSAQIRDYAWALARARGIDPVGVIVDERLNEIPKLPRLVKAKRKGEGIAGMVPSHAVDQLCTAESYRLLCEQYRVDTSADTYAALDRRIWQHREPIMFRRGELDTVGRELVSAARLIRDLDSGALYPSRNASPQNCRGCKYQDICGDPLDAAVDTWFERTVPKRLRGIEPEPTTEEALP